MPRKLFTCRACRICKTNFTISRAMITNLPDKIKTWDDVIKDFGITCCENPELNNSTHIKHTFLEEINYD